MNDFAVGDEVLHRDYLTQYYGRVVGVHETTIRVQFFASAENTYKSEGYDFGTGLYCITDIIRKGPPLTPQELVTNKCKKLWNKSKFVQKQNRLAY